MNLNLFMFSILYVIAILKTNLEYYINIFISSSINLLLQSINKILYKNPLSSLNKYVFYKLNFSINDHYSLIEKAKFLTYFT